MVVRLVVPPDNCWWRGWSNSKRFYCHTSPVRPRILVSSTSTNNDSAAGGLRVFVVSDLHTDYSDNLSWVRDLSKKRKKPNNDVLLVAGDVAETCQTFELTMYLLKHCFHRVLFVPGNHDLWCRRENSNACDSLEKLDKLFDTCQRIGVETKPVVVDDLGIIPLFSWYHESFDKEMDISGFRLPPLEMACKDFHACKWPEGINEAENSLALFFDVMNGKNHDLVEEIKRKCRVVISFSHFLPRQELCPEKRMLFYPKLPKIIGSDFLESRLRSIHRDKGSAYACHVFGHTHFCWDAVLDGIRYVQAPLAYPRERKRRMNGGEDWLPFCIYHNGKLAPRLSPCYWSDYYDHNPRAPEFTELAPWVARFYSRSPS
ncbi:OLC1v1011939C1 [Oldenlandia corymbosa var. corymbosa]|uniref:OLC1v1011939C1 n=1 Tax=Oldenlandia corymbosa var. corymbosa TaxID=529605 RepID=A0AAV1DUU6_OLDCO|nr:OLC1v1011939C1 [Oldenlandia corymbosa var. corymbosa]